MPAHQNQPPAALRSIIPIAPGIGAALALGGSDVLVKFILAAHCSVLTMVLFRSVVGLAFVTTWLCVGQRPRADARVRWISLGVGLLFSGLLFCLFEAIDAIDVPTAVLTYFAYPLLTGLVASATGLEPLRWRGAVCALVAFLGLAVMIGAHPAGLALAGIGYALGAACCRTAQLIVTRAYLVEADARLTTWYAVLGQSFVYVSWSLAGKAWNPPQSSAGWIALVAMTLATTAGVLFVFLSTVRIGSFRTALIMNLEPLSAMVLSAFALGEVITPIQAIGSAIMLGALVAFQLWK